VKSSGVEDARVSVARGGAVVERCMPSQRDRQWTIVPAA